MSNKQVFVALASTASLAVIVLVTALVVRNRPEAELRRLIIPSDQVSTDWGLSPVPASNTPLDANPLVTSDRGRVTEIVSFASLPLDAERIESVLMTCYERPGPDGIRIHEVGLQAFFFTEPSFAAQAKASLPEEDRLRFLQRGNVLAVLWRDHSDETDMALFSVWQRHIEDVMEMDARDD
jgi:hypothetical protein